MTWPHDMVWWHIYPLGFTGAPIHSHASAAPNQGVDRAPAPAPDHTVALTDSAAAPRLSHLTAWLDYACDLGVTGVLLGPIFASSTHGYDTLDYYSIDPRLGTMADFDTFVQACRERGLRIVLDGVFSHISVDHPWVTQALTVGQGSVGAQMLDINWEAESGPTPHVFEGHSTLVRLAHDRAQVADYVADVMTFWLERGADGWRLDAAYSVSPTFWAAALSRVRDRFPHAWFLGEVIHGDYPAFVAHSRVDTLTQYELWKAVWSSLNDRNMYEFEWSLRRHQEFLEHFIPQTFIGNHDVTRIVSKVGDANAITALVMLMSVGGIPSIYYGDEVGLTGVKEERVGGDDAIRPAYPAAPDSWPSSSQAEVFFAAHTALIALRRARPWLTQGRTYTVDLSNEYFRYRTVARDDDSRFIEVAIDLSSPNRVRIIDEAGALLWEQLA